MGAFKASDFLVEGLGEIEPAFSHFDGQMFAGLLPTTKNPSTEIPADDDDDDDDAEYMFWLFRPTERLDSLTIWFNGGPGCSSFDGTLFENSPVTSSHYPAGYPKTTAHEDLIPNPWAWTNVTDMLYVEMPAGTGFSSGTIPTTEAELSESFYNFLKHFYETFPVMKSKRLFLFGESYAGMYVPSIAHEIHRRNQRILWAADDDDDDDEVESETINLQGIGVGNGWMDAKVQGRMVIDYAWWHGMIDSATRESLQAVYDNCISPSNDMAPLGPPFHEFTIPDECNIAGAVLQASGADAFPKEWYMSPNTYDVTTFDLYPILFNDNSTYSDFFNNPDVKKALHAPLETTWSSCVPGAGRRRLDESEEVSLPLGMTLLANDRPVSVVPYVAELLDDAGIRVLIYNGDRDMSVCAQGTEKVLDDMKWSGAKEWRRANRGLWMVDNSNDDDDDNNNNKQQRQQVAGFAKSLHGLDFVVVYNSGHLVPNNRPIAALDLISRFVRDESYLDIALPRFDRAGDAASISSSSLANNEATGRSVVVLHDFVVIITVATIFFCLGMLFASRDKKRAGYTTLSNGNDIELER